MIKHKFLMIWIFLFFIIVFIGIYLSNHFMNIRITLIIILSEVVISFLFYPIFIFDRRQAEKIENKKRIKRLEEQKKKEQKEEIEDLKIRIEELEKKVNDKEVEKEIERFCELCHEKIDKDASVCPHCGNSLPN
ncbi:MAG: hypothetical protein ACFFAN_02355 [Promethearchaeota archaeon]